MTRVAEWVGRGPTKRKVACSIPGQGTCLGCGLSQVGAHTRGKQSMLLSLIDVSLSLFLPPFPSL